jgi:hypothetical protein
MTEKETVASLINQLGRYGAVKKLGPSHGIFTDPAGNVWTWNAIMREVSFSKAGWRPRSLNIENVSLAMFNWLYDDDDCREALEFKIGLKEVVGLFGRKGAHEVFVKVGPDR